MAFIRHQITCVVKTDNKQPYNRIAYIGGYNGSHWRIALDKAVEGIEKGKWQFFVDYEGKRLNIIIGMLNGRKYLKTDVDENQPEVLLNLPDCF